MRTSITRTHITKRWYWPCYKRIIQQHSTPLDAKYYAIDNDREVYQYTFRPTLDDGSVWLPPTIQPVDGESFLDLYVDIGSFLNVWYLKDWRTTLIYHEDNILYWCVDDDIIELP